MPDPRSETEPIPANEQSVSITPRWLSIAGAAAYCSLSERSIHNLLASGKLQAHRPVRGRVLIDRIELDLFIASATTRLRSGRGKPRRSTSRRH